MTVLLVHVTKYVKMKLVTILVSVMLVTDYKGEALVLILTNVQKHQASVVPMQFAIIQ